MSMVSRGKRSLKTARPGVAACVVGLLIMAGMLGVARLVGPSALADLIARGSAGNLNPLDTPNGTWSSLGSQAPGRDGHGFVYDSKADRFILFGGAITANGFTNSTWSYDYANNTWSNITPRVGPPIRAGSGMVYDSDAYRVIVFGGLGVAGVVGIPLGDTWVFDYTNNTWTNRTSILTPTPRVLGGMVYDSLARRTILFGGSSLLGLLGDTWSYDYATNKWAAVNTTVPGLLYAPAMTYDSTGGRTLLFGGVTATGQVPIWKGDTWSFWFANRTWMNLNPSPHPSNRAGSAMTYDSISQVALLFGGADTFGNVTSGYFNDTWIYEPARNAWTNVTPVHSPPPRVLSAVAYSGSANRSVLFGGLLGGTPPLDDVWVFQLAPLPIPVPPSQPLNLRAVGGDAQVNLTWAAPVLPGTAPISGYRVYRGPSSGGETYLASLGVALRFSDTTVTNGHTYYYEVSAVSAAGEGLKSLEASATPEAPPSAPSAPRSLHAVAGNLVVNLSWLEPASPGTSAVTNYTVYRGDSSGTETRLVVLGNVTEYADTAVANGRPYFYQLSAANSIGEGPTSSEVSATPTGPAELPTAPRGLTATGGTGPIVLSWHVPASNGNSTITGYKVYRATAPATETLFAVLGPVLMYTDAQVAIGQTYYYEVTAVNRVGEGPTSNEASATATAPPDTTSPTISITSPANNSVFTSTVVTISGSASDNVAVAKVEISTDGVTWSTVSGTSAWTSSVTLHEGSNTIYARATDSSGNLRTTRITVVVQLSASGTPGLPLAILGGIGVVIVVVAAALALILQRRRRQPGKRPVGP